jgi:hypothetical protein
MVGLNGETFLALNNKNKQPKMPTYLVSDELVGSLNRSEQVSLVKKNNFELFLKFVLILKLLLSSRRYNSVWYSEK